MMDWNGHMTSGGWVFSILAMLIVVALVAAAIVWMTREFGSRGDRGLATAMSARDVLDRRLASGEIKTAEYEQLRGELAGRPDAVPEPPPSRPVDAGE